MNYLNLKQINSLHQEEIEEAVGQVLKSGWYLHGEATRTFESQYAQYIGTDYCVGVANGLDALTLILQSYIELGHLRPGDEVIVPANTFIATLLAITANRLVPVLVEPRMDTLQINETLIEKAITPRTRALMLVHLYGRCAMTPGIEALCLRHNLLLIEDNAQAHGCFYNQESRPQTPPQPSNSKTQKSARTGAISHAAAHSFYPGKNLGALGDGGAVTTNDTELAETVRMLGNYGSAHKYEFHYKGRNSRLDEVQAAILSVKLKYLDQENQRRRQIAHYYTSHIKSTLALFIPHNAKADCVYHIFPVLSDKRDALRNSLAEQGIETAIHYPIPPHRQLCYKEWNHLSLPVTEHIHASELSLPCNQSMTDGEVNQVVEAVNRFLTTHP